MKKSLLVSSALLLSSLFASAQTSPRNQLTPTPPMGWMTWNLFQGNINEQLIRETADAMVEGGFRDAGYKYIFIDDIKHIGGIGIGGGTLQGLSRLLLKTDDIKQVAALAEEGDLSHINVLIKDICANPLQGLPMDAIASLFGNAKTNASREDIALGLIWMVLQSICSATILSSLGSGIKEFVMIGNLTLLPQVRHVFPATERLYGVKFRIPRYSEFCTAIGAALCYLNVHKPTL